MRIKSNLRKSRATALVPNPDRAYIDTEGKLRGYCLNPSHLVGGHKARVFAAALGLTTADAETLRGAIVQAIAVTDAIDRGISRFGQLYSIDFKMVSSAGQATVRTNWIIENGKDFARLVSCSVKEGD